MKIGNRDHLLKLKEDGEVHFGTYEGYRKQEKAEFELIKAKILNKAAIISSDFDSTRRDSMEGLHMGLAGKLNMKIRHESGIIELKGIESKLNLFQNDYTHLYCMFGFAPLLSEDFTFDQRLRHFGDHILLFDSKIFLSALAANIQGNFHFDYVTYNDCSDASNLGPFRKRQQYAYQYEYRIAANLTSTKLHIGDVLSKSTNTILITYEELNELRLDIKP